MTFLVIRYVAVFVWGYSTVFAQEMPSRLLVALSDEAAKNARIASQVPDEIEALGLVDAILIPIFKEPHDPTLRDSWYERGLNHWFRLEAKGLQPEGVYQSLHRGRSVSAVHLIYPHEALVLPNDYSINNMWALAKMQCPAAWDIQSGNTDIIVTTIDTGCKITHVDLAANIRVNPGEDLNGNGVWDVSDNNGVDDDLNFYVDDLVGYDFVSHTPDTARWAVGEEYGPMDNEVFPDIHGHGTHVMGTAAAVTNNGSGVAAASWNVKAMPLRAGYAWVDGGGTLRGSGFTDDFAAAVAYATENGARVISISFGGSGSDPSYEAALLYARDNNVIVFASAGNSNNTNLVYPAAYAHVVGVAATDSLDRKASFSSYGTWVSISAPGVYIWSTLPNGFYRPVDYDAWNGTSMASPNAAAVGALLLSYIPQLTDDQVESLILATSDDLDVINPVYAGELGTGRVNAHAALMAACDSVILQAPEVVILPNGAGVRVSWKQVPCANEYELSSSATSEGIFTQLAVVADTFYVDPLDVWPMQFYQVVARR